MGKWPNRYKLYYDKEFDFSTVNTKHVIPPTQYIDFLRMDIHNNGLKNPVQAHFYHEASHIHPGKCRVAAYKLLDRHTIPAIIIDKEGEYKPSKTAVEIQPEDAQAYLTDDCVAEYDHRYFNIKKRAR